jgi:hypothetical protein
MNTNLLVLIIILGAVILVGVAAYLSNYLTKHKIDAEAVIQKALQGLSIADSFALAITPFLPVAYGNIISKLFQFTLEGVNTAEALFKAAVLSSDQRKATATSLITSKLVQAGVKPDDEINKLISVSVDLMCRFLPKTTVAVPTATVPQEVVSAPQVQA